MTDREKLIELLGKGCDYAHDKCYDVGCDECEGGYHNGCTLVYLADYLLANGVTVNKKKEKPSVDLTGKCGSCAFSEKATGVFGGSQCYVRCTNREHLEKRMYYGRPLVAVRQRTAKACKKYTPKLPTGRAKMEE